MFSNKDIEFRTIFVINCMEGRTVRVCNGELFIEDPAQKRTLTKFPFQKILALFFIGQVSITSALIDKCRFYNVCIVVTKLSLRPLFFFSANAEANYSLRQRQYLLPEDDIVAAKSIVYNKISSQLTTLGKIRGRSSKMLMETKELCARTLQLVEKANNYEKLLAMEGNVAKHYFACCYGRFGWKGRKPHEKTDYLNAVLDLGYTVLFNFVECFASMFGFDMYVGVYHKLCFKRKSLVCDLMEPFRCIIDNTIRNALVKEKIQEGDFEENDDGQWHAKHESAMEYYRMFFESLIPYKNQVFLYVRDYYRAFTRGKVFSEYPQFKL